jgi:uncharacterized delta-60 repeat protein
MKTFSMQLRPHHARSFAGLVMLCLALAPVVSAQPGSLDTSFDPGAGVDQSVFAVAVQPADGKVIIAGDFTTVASVPLNGIARLNSNGDLDSSFDPGSGADDLVNGVALQGNNVIIAGYFTAVNGTNQGYVARLNSTGGLDTSFDSGSGADSPVLSLAVQSDGKVLLGGEFTSINGTNRNNIARLNSGGSLDTGFDPGTGVSSAALSSVRAIAVQEDDRVIIGGSFTSVDGAAHTNIARLNSNGTLDGGFNPSVGVAGAGVLAGVYILTVQSGGKIVVGGDFTAINGNPRTNLARLNTNGTLDLSFNPTNGPDFAVNSILSQANGKIVIGGFFTSVNGTARKYVARLNSDGSLDSGFNPGLGPDDAVYAAALQADGKVLIGGLFTSFDATPRHGIARLYGDAIVSSPLLFNPIRTNNTFRVSLLTFSGSTYVLEFKNALPDGGWTAILPGVPGDGTLKALTDPSATGLQRFYRVRVE